ncbi:MAG: coenzyme F420-0:L-glutamate ligase, partial [Patescibacteria group bacterium]
MKVISLKTHRITPKDRDLLPILDCALPRKLKEGSIVVITSKIVALTEGRVADPKKVSKGELAKKEAEWCYPLEKSKYRVVLTIKDKRIMFTSGIDESNAGGMYVLLPADPQGTANKVRMYLQKRF